MKYRSSQIPLALCIGIFLCLFENQVDAQTCHVLPVESQTLSTPSGFTKVIDSKIDKSDVQIIRQLIEESEYAEFLKSAPTDKIYVLNGDRFREGFPDFKVFGKDVLVRSKYELMDGNIPFFISINGYNKQESTCEATISLKENKPDGKFSTSGKIVLEKSADIWTAGN